MFVVAVVVTVQSTVIYYDMRYEMSCFTLFIHERLVVTPSHFF
jgi:hypothetical protein